MDDLRDLGDKEYYGVGWRSYFCIMDLIMFIWWMIEIEFIECYGFDFVVFLCIFLFGYDFYVNFVIVIKFVIF